MLVCITIYQVNNKHMFTLQAIDKVECLTQSLEPIKFEDMGLLGWFCWGGWGQDMGSNSSFDKHPQDQCSVVVVGAKTWEVTVHLANTPRTATPLVWKSTCSSSSSATSRWRARGSHQTATSKVLGYQCVIKQDNTAFYKHIVGYSCKHFHPRILGKKFKLG